MKVEIRKTKKCIECHNDSGKGWLKPNSPYSQASLVLFYFFLFTPTILFYTGITHLTIQTPAVVILYSLIRVSRGKEEEVVREHRLHYPFITVSDGPSNRYKAKSPKNVCLERKTFYCLRFWFRSAC